MERYKKGQRFIIEIENVCNEHTAPYRIKGIGLELRESELDSLVRYPDVDEYNRGYNDAQKAKPLPPLPFCEDDEILTVLKSIKASIDHEGKMIRSSLTEIAQEL